MAINPYEEQKVEEQYISKLNKCVITNGKILDIKPSSVNGCITILDMTIKSDSGYYIIEVGTTTKNDSQECRVMSGYNGDSYKSDIGKEKNFLINKDGFGLITTGEYFIKQFPNTETCKPNLTTKEYYYNYLLPDIKKEILNSNHTIYYFGTLLIIVLGIIGVLIYRKFKKIKKQG